MSTIKLKRIKQAVDTGVTQPLSIGGVASDNSDEVMNIASNGNLQFKKIIQTNGIKFPATQVPSADPKTLDDYEEGTWTPILSAQNGVLTSYTSSGKYTKIGNVVQIEFASQIIDKGTGTGWLQIIGLPFAVQNAYAKIVISEPFYTGWLCMGALYGTEILSITKHDNTLGVIQNDYGYISNFTYISA